MLSKIQYLFAALGLVSTIVNAQSSVAWTDPVTGITFQAFQSADYGYSFGLALPTNPTNELIGQLIAPIDAWAGVDFGGAMVNNLLLPGWAYDGNIVWEFRMASDYTLPYKYNGTEQVITALDCGTYVNSTHWSYTFVCTNCNTWVDTNGATVTVDLTGTFALFGWSLGTDTPADPSDPNSSLIEHEGFGLYGMILTAATNANYESFKTCGGNGGGGGGGGGTTSSSTTTTSHSSTSTSSKTTTTSSHTTTSTSAKPTQTGTVTQYGQCGGINWTGGTVCISPFICTFISDYYSQCL